MHLLEKLNPQQREAAETVEGPLLILAGAGSGKTRVITYRIAHLIQDLGVHADSVLAVTFTNKAAGEMGERVTQLVRGHSVAQPTIATFHSFCVRVLRRDIEALKVGDSGYRRDFAIYDESDQQSLIKSAMKRLGVDDKQLTPRAVLSRISWAKNHMLDPQEVYLQAGDPKMERIAQIYEVYRKELRRANALDFDDLLLETVRLLKSSVEVREKYNRRYQYLMIDEYQDTNLPQYELMKMLSGERQNVCVVGDEDQSIYSWRGADIKNILEFERDFPKAKVIRLEQNYRSTQTILEAASAVVANNKMRKGKNLWTARTGGGKIGYYEAADGENESLFVADHAAKFLKQATQSRSSADAENQPRLAVLYRTNSQSRLFEEAMRRYGLKYNVVGGFSFYERAEIKDMIGYLKLINNLDDSIALLRVINTPARGIGKNTMETLERIALETGLSLWGAAARAIREELLPPRALASLTLFKQIIDDSRAMLFGSLSEKLQADVGRHDRAAPTTVPEMIADAVDTDIAFDFGEQEAGEAEVPGDSPPVTAAEGVEVADGFRTPGSTATLPEVLKFLIDRTGYIKQLEQEGSPEAIARIENLQELVNAARDSRDRGETLEEFLDHAALVSDVDQYEANAGITLMTLHAAKGLEFSLVYLVGMEEGLFPHSRTFMDPAGIEEERRLCYVGMTRAMDGLVITRARYRRRYASDMPENSIPSRFLEEIPPQLFEDMGNRGSTRQPAAARADHAGDSHFNYEDEDQSAAAYSSGANRYEKPKKPGAYSTFNSADNIADFFSSRGKKFSLPKPQPAPQPGKGRAGFRPGQKVRHPKYGEGTVYQREGEGESAKITVQFPRFGLKKLVEKYAQLEKA